MIKTICYGKEKIWNDRKDAILFFLSNFFNSEGNEKERYKNILIQLIDGKNICSDI